MSALQTAGLSHPEIQTPGSAQCSWDPHPSCSQSFKAEFLNPASLQFMMQGTKLEKVFAVPPKCPIPREFWSCCSQHVNPRMDLLGPQITAAAPIHSDTNIPAPEGPTAAGGWHQQYSPVTHITGHWRISRVVQVAQDTPWQEHPHRSSWIGSRCICLYCFHSMKENEASPFKLKTEDIFYIYLYIKADVYLASAAQQKPCPAPLAKCHWHTKNCPHLD